MRKTALLGAGVVAMTLLACAARADGQSGANAAAKGAPPTAASSAVEQAHLASKLADYGRRAQNPMALVLAAELTAATAGPDADRAKTTTGPATAGGGKARKPATTVASLLDEAHAMAGPDASLQPAIQRVAAMESKGGRPRGPRRTVPQVKAGETDVFSIHFRGGEPASIYVNGDGDTDLDLYVFDQNGNQVCSDTDDTNTMLCQWTPAWTGIFTVKVKNYGRVYNEYVLMTN